MHTDPTTAPRGVLAALNSDGSTPDDPFAAPSEGWRWLHLAHGSKHVKSYIEETLPESIAEALLDEETRPRCDQSNGGVVFIGRGVNLDPATTPEDMVSVRAWLTEDRLITIVMRRLRSAETVASTFDTPDAPVSPADILSLLLDQMVKRMEATVEDLVDRIDALQERVVDPKVQTPTIAELAPLRLRAITLHRYLVPLLDAADKLAQTAIVKNAPGESADLAETRDDLRRLVEDLAAAEARAEIARDEIQSEADERLNKRVYALTVLAAVFLPLTVLTGLLGMNVGGIPLADTPAGFAITSGILVVLVTVALVVLRRLRWI